MEIPVTFENLLSYREKTLGEVFWKEKDADTITLVLPYNGLFLVCDIEAGSSEAVYIAKTANRPFFIEDIRPVSHDFANSNTWPTDPITNLKTSLFKVAPPYGRRYIIHDIVMRFSRFAKIDLNIPCFSVWKKFGQELVMVKYNEFSTLRDLINQAESFRLMSGFAGSAFSEDMIEITFKYAGAQSFFDSPVVLKGNFGEYLNIWLKNNEQIRSIYNNEQLLDPCIVSFIGKATDDF